MQMTDVEMTDDCGSTGGLEALSNGWGIGCCCRVDTTGGYSNTGGWKVLNDC